MDTKQSKTNTILLLIIGGLGAVAWFLATHTLSVIEGTQAASAVSLAALNKTVEALHAEMMPRVEVQVELQGFRDHSAKQDIDLAELKLRTTAMELELQKMRK
jgi:hypothetical protein